MSFTIPKKQVTTNATLNDDDASLLEGLPTKLVDTVQQYLHNCNIKTYNDIEKLKIHNHNNKINYVKNINSTYVSLMSEIEHCFFDKPKDLYWTVKGSYDSDYKQPSLNYWIECNEAKYTAIKIIVDDLRTNGWNPKISTSACTVDHDDGMYYNGNELIVICMFD